MGKIEIPTKRSKSENGTCLSVPKVYVSRGEVTFSLAIFMNGLIHKYSRTKLDFTSAAIVTVAAMCNDSLIPRSDPPVLGAKILISWASILFIYTTLISKNK